MREPLQNARTSLRMKNYRPLLLQNISLALPGLQVRQLRLNHHTPETLTSRHQHAHGQLLVYLSGRGRQELEGTFHDCRPGTCIFVRAGQQHAFERAKTRVPLVLVLDLDIEETRSSVHPCAVMPEADLARVRTAVTRLFGLRQAEHREAMLAVGSAVLEVLDRALLCLGWLRGVNRYASSQAQNTTRLVERLLDRLDTPETTLEQISARAGYQVDHLNRRLKQECGLTLGQLRARQRLGKAQKLIRMGLPMQTVAERIGILDNNYFSRWFRQQTGQTPTAWKKAPRNTVRF